MLAPVDPAQLSETEVMTWALPRAANQFWMLGEPTQAAAFLQATRNRVAAPNARATLDALAATFAMNAGTPHRALRLADEVLASPFADEQAVGLGGIGRRAELGADRPARRRRRAGGAGSGR